MNDKTLLNRVPKALEGYNFTCFFKEELHDGFIVEDNKAGNHDVDLAQRTVWRFAQTQADFNFGKLQHPMVDRQFLIPYSGDITPGMPIAAFSYPGLPPTKSQPDTCYYSIHKIQPAKIEEAFQMFYVKHVSVGTVVNYDNAYNRLFTITASTLLGASGGPIVPLNDPTTFCGIHTKGWPETNYNVSVSVHHPHFVVSYARFVVPHLNPVPLTYL
eukprot:Phypoly_transcript_07521.p1 GENE.Phypoly_transcript_07521~~Phypoly_transcript_07521.p1  ORF type:complete len:215 (+),score=7.04 Phypoly_transcript_07521:846-1490(+)